MPQPVPVVVVELAAIMAEDGDAPARASVVRDSALEQLGRAQQAGARIFLLGGPLAREDGGDLDDLLGKLDTVQQRLQEAGARLESAIIINQTSAERDLAEGVAEALQDVCQRLSCSVQALVLVAAGAEVIAAARSAGVTQVRVVDSDGAFPAIAAG